MYGNGGFFGGKCVGDKHVVLMSHGEEAVMVSNGFEVVARSKQGVVVAVEYDRRWFMNYIKEQTNGEAMINSIKNGDQPFPRVTQVSIAETSSTEQPHLKDKSTWSDQEKKIQKIDRLARSLLIQGLPNDIYSLIDSNTIAKDLWDALARQMLGYEYGEQDRKADVLYEYGYCKIHKTEPKLDKNGHENGKSTQELRIYHQKSTLINSCEDKSSNLPKYP
uniref:GMP synthase [glutamine-hydrolyzing]-like n=1 Tax=Tanacetum cinerariifolium TaxID=118510 RepID=A0A6L2K168_TANCI|nr:GMP synthase [glutamine-hydrolyzing]-like [Tanacetum cinerariifolium]